MEWNEEDSNIAKLLSPKKRDKKRQYSFYVDADLYKIFMSLCKKHRISGSKVISAFMKDFIDKYGAGKKEDEEP
jgi:hypothetical protein